MLLFYTKLFSVIGCCLAQLIEDQQMLDSDDEAGMDIRIIIQAFYI